MSDGMLELRQEAQLPGTLAEAVGVSDLMVKHRYLQDLYRGEAAVLQEDALCLKPGRRVRLFQIGSMTYESGADVLDRFGCVFSAISRYRTSAVYILRFDGSFVRLYMGVGCEDRAELSMVYDTFKGAFDGNFTGCRALRLNNDENEALLEDVFRYDREERISVACVSGMLEEAKREDEVRQYGLERVIDGMRGERFDLLVLAEAVEAEAISAMRDAFEKLSSQMSPFKEQTISVTRGETDTYAEAMGRSISDTISKTVGTSHNWGTNWSKNKTKGSSQNEPDAKNKAIAIGSTVLAVAGAGVLAATGMLGAAATVGSTALSGMFLSGPVAKVVGAVADERQRSSSESETDIYGGQEGSGSHEDVTQGSTRADNWNVTSSLAQTLSESRQYAYKNRAIESILDSIDQRISQLKQCESGGAYSCAAYILAADNAVANRAASLYKAALMGMGGKESSVYINVWDDRQDTLNLCQALGQLQHPRIHMREFPEMISQVLPGTLVSAKDMPRYFLLPRHSITGITVEEHARFARDPHKKSGSGAVGIGNLYHMGLEDRSVPIELDIQSLAMHTFITGTTGMGKSTAVFNLLNALRAQGVKFMVVEPVKGEYKNEFGNDEDVHVYGTNQEYTPLLRINPFRFPKGIHVLEHMDGLIEILTVCWPLYAAMPAVLKEAVERAYEAAGWDLKRSRNRYGEEIYPTFRDVMEQTYRVLEESQYSNENKGNYIGSLCMRLKKLTTGIEGMIFTSDDLSDEALFDENVIVDISRIRANDTKALIMGLLVFKLQEYRQRSTGGFNRALHHVTVLEEAHQLMRRDSVQPTGEGSAIAGKSVEMLANAIAETRSYGEGFIIADQAPAKLDESVIRNTNTKIVMCLPDSEDRILTGQAMGLSEAQIHELSGLSRGVAAVYQNDWPEAVLVKLPVFPGGSGTYRRKAEDEPADSGMEALKDAIVTNRMEDWLAGLEREGMQAFLRSDAATELKCIVLQYRKAGMKERSGLWCRAVYACFSEQAGMQDAGKAKSVSEWKKNTLARLELRPERYGEREIDLFLGALLREQMQRDDSCSRLFCEFSQHLRVYG